MQALSTWWCSILKLSVSTNPPLILHCRDIKHGRENRVRLVALRAGVDIAQQSLANKVRCDEKIAFRLFIRKNKLAAHIHGHSFKHFKRRWNVTRCLTSLSLTYLCIAFWRCCGHCMGMRIHHQHVSCVRVWWCHSHPTANIPRSGGGGRFG